MFPSVPGDFCLENLPAIETMKFEDLGVEGSVIETCEKNGIREPTEIQRRVIPVVATGKDVVAVSQTGSGKTLAFVLPIVSKLLLKNRAFYTLVVTPTRELSLQIAECFKMFQSTGLRVCSLVGGESFSCQANALSKQPHVVVGTPGRVADHILKTKSFKCSKIRKLVLDEADRFFEQDFADELETIFQSIREKRQILLFTATMSERVSRLCGTVLRKPRVIQITEKYKAVDTLDEYYLLVAMKRKDFALFELLRTRPEGSAMVFVSMCVSAQVVSVAMNMLGISSEALHGGLDQGKREDVMRRFREGSFNVLICTDVGSRGLDIRHVDLVVNFDVPSSGRDYVHRVGRTARAGENGVAITFVTQYDIEQLQRIEFVLGRKLERIEVSERDFESVDRRIQDAMETARETVNEGLRIKRQRRSR